MKALILKELRENLKWVPLPGLAILLVFLIDKPDEPMLDVTAAFFFCLIGVAFAAALGFLQIFFEGHGDKRSLLLHRPLSPSRIFLGKTIAGVGLYLLALGIPFVCVESWMARPGYMPAPYHWRTSLPWLADILSGLVYYFAGMLTAQRDVRWYGSRGLAVAAAFMCSYLVWTLPEFWQALVAIGIMGLGVSLAAYGSFRSGGAYIPQSRLPKAALAMTFLAGLLIVSVLGKQLIGEWFDSGVEWAYHPDRQGRVLMVLSKQGGEIGHWLDLTGREPADLKGKEIGSKIKVPYTINETPLNWSYRNSGRFYVQCTNDSKPSQEIWYYDQTQSRLFGYDTILHQGLGSFGPDGFVPSGQQSGERFLGELLFRSDRWNAMPAQFLAFPGGVYDVNFTWRTIRTLFTPAAGETVTCARWWSDDLDRKRKRVVVSTDKSFHFLKGAGSPAVSLPRAYDFHKYRFVFLGLFEKPERYFVWYQSWIAWTSYLEPEEFRNLPGPLHEYDAAGRELASQIVPPPAYPEAPAAQALFGLVTPMTEAATLVGATRYLRSEARSNGCTHKPVLLGFLENSQYYIPGTAPDKSTPGGLVSGYLALILLSAAASALGCFLLASRYAFSNTRRLGWALVGFLFGWVGLVLMLVLQEWPARIACPKCGKLRVVTHDNCEHCGAAHAVPALDGTEIFDPGAPTMQPAMALR